MMTKELPQRIVGYTVVCDGVRHVCPRCCDQAYYGKGFDLLKITAPPMGQLDPSVYCEDCGQTLE